MKTYDEMVNSLLARRDSYTAEKNRRRSLLIRTASSMCCVCLVALLGFGILQSGNHANPLEQTPPSNADPAVADTPDESHSTNAPPTSETQSSPVTDGVIRIQKVEELPDFPKQMMIALMCDDFIRMSREQINAYYEVNIFPTVPSDLREKEEQTFGIFRRKSTGEVYWDGNKIHYGNSDDSRAVNVNIDKDCVPFDFWNIFDDVQTRSVINNTEVGIAQTSCGDFYAEFLFGGVGFRIVTTGLTEDEFLHIISSLLQ